MDPDQHSSTSDAPVSRSVLMRKTQAGQEVRQTHTMSLAKALRLTLAKVADDQLDMAMAVIGARVETCGSDHLATVFNDAGLLMLLDGSQRRQGAAVLDADFVGALIQQQTMGKVTAPMDVDPRPMTATDAAICAPFIDALLTRAGSLPDAPDDRALIEGFSFGARVEDTRLLLLALEDPEYQIVHLTVDVAGGVRQGNIMLCFPTVMAQRGHAEPADEGAESAPAPKPATLDKNVLALKVDLNVAIATLTLPISKVQDIAVGDVFDLGITAFDQASVQTKEGRRLSCGTLGQINGTRALQLEQGAGAGTLQPRRRVADRALLDLSAVSGDGTGTQKSQSAGAVAEAVDAPQAQLDTDTMPQVDDMPYMSDLPGFEEDDRLPQMGTG